MTSKIKTFYVHDYETFGTSPAMDRPAQFAGVRTDMDFNIVDQPLMMYCAPADDYLPKPEAVMITGITPQQARSKGINEAEFARQIHQAFSIPNTCILGYNNIRFDDEVSRNIFYRSFYDPYDYTWKNGNSRWDLLDVMRACYTLCPEGIVWPKDKNGIPSFRLAHLARANGIEHNQAHDAMSDVYATIEIAKKIKHAQPQLFDFLLQYRTKNKLNTLICVTPITPLVYISGMFGAARSNTSWVAPLAWHPAKRNTVIMCDLSGDLTPLFTLNSEQLREQLYTPHDALEISQTPLPIKLVQINKCPVLAPAKALLPENAARLGINRLSCLQNLQMLRQHPKLQEKVAAIFDKQKPYSTYKDVDARLYDGLFSDFDKAAMEIIQKTKPHHLAGINISFRDARMKELLFRFRARNYPNTLNNIDQKRWQRHRQAILNREYMQEYQMKLKTLYNLHEGDKEKTTLLQALFDYSHELESHAFGADDSYKA